MNTTKTGEKLKITDDFLKAQASNLFTSSRTAHELMMDRVSKDMDQYDGEFSEDEKKFSEVLGIPRLFINKTYTNTQRILVDVVDTFFFDPEEIVDVASWKNVPYETRQIVKALMNYRLNGNPINFYQEIYEMGLDALRTVSGAVLKIYPELDVQERPKMELLVTDFGSTEVPTGETEEYIAYYEPRLETVKPEDLYVSNRATWKDYYKYPMIHRYKKTRDYLKMMGFKNVDAVPPADEQGFDNSVKEQRAGENQSPFSSDTLIQAAQDVWVYEVWDFLPGKDGMLESGSYYCLGDQGGPLVVGKGWEINELPYKFDHFEHNRPPFVLAYAYPEPHKREGKSFPWITESNQREINAIANQEREGVARALRPTTYINRDANVDLAALITRRIGGYTQGDGPASEAIQEIAMSNPLALTQNHRARVDQDYFDAGIPPNLLGTASSEETATGANQQLVNANKKISLVIKNLAYSGVLPALKYLFRLEQVYCSDEFIQKVTGRVLGWGFIDDNVPARDYIQGDFDFKINVGVNKRSQTNTLLLIADRLNQANMNIGQLIQLGVLPPESARFKDPMKIFEWLLSINGFKNEAELDIRAQAPPPQIEAGGVPSQASQVLDSTGDIAQSLPSAPGNLNVIG